MKNHLYLLIDMMNNKQYEVSTTGVISEKNNKQT